MADEGSVEMGEKVILHYFAQHVLESLTPGRTVLEEMQAWSPSRTVGQLRSLLGIFQFSGEDVFKRVEVLSGGEKNRLALARLTLDPGNFLVLDEPTNHLDLPTREALEEALAAFGGTLLFVSHDRYFINRVATRVAAFKEGRLVLHQGGYDDYVAAGRAAENSSRILRAPGSGRGGGAPREGKEKRPAEAGSRDEANPSSSPPENRRGSAPASAAHPVREQRRLEAEARNRRGRELRITRERIAKIEARILPHETRLKEIDAALAAGGTYKEPGLARALGEEKKNLEIELAHLYDEWEEATSDLQREESAPP
jgi:ATP-binding cassette subfamily F protein 3